MIFCVIVPHLHIRISYYINRNYSPFHWLYFKLGIIGMQKCGVKYARCLDRNGATVIIATFQKVNMKLQYELINVANVAVAALVSDTVTDILFRYAKKGTHFLNPQKSEHRPDPPFPINGNKTPITAGDVKRPFN